MCTGEYLGVVCGHVVANGGLGTVTGALVGRVLVRGDDVVHLQDGKVGGEVSEDAGGVGFACRSFADTTCALVLG